MKLFDDFEAVRFPEENLIFITRSEFLYYIYNEKNKIWKKYENSGNDRVTVENYNDVREEDLKNALNGKYPQKETDFMRFCDPSELCFSNMMEMLQEDYESYISDGDIYDASYKFLIESNILHRSYEELKKLFDKALELNQSKEEILSKIKNLCFDFFGRDIFKKEIGIVDGHNSSSYFWIMPVRVIDYSDTNSTDSVAEMFTSEISIEEDDVYNYLTPFLYKYFDNDLKANKNREDVKGFDWNLTYNFFTFDSISKILNDITNTIDALSTGRTNEFTEKVKENRCKVSNKLLQSKSISDEQIEAYVTSLSREYEAEIDLIIDFYHRFIYRMEYMMKVGKEKGYDLISFMGP